MPLLPFAPPPASGGTFPLSNTAATAATIEYQTNVTGDTQERFTIGADGKMSWGSGSGAADVTLYRNGSNQLFTTTSQLMSTGTFYIGVNGTAYITFDAISTRLDLNIPIFCNNMSQTTLNGTTAGTVLWAQPFQGSVLSLFIGYANGYENTSATAQTISYPTAFSHTPVILSSPTGGGGSWTTTATTLTLPASMSGTESGYVIVMGF